jgi:putative transposase
MPRSTREDYAGAWHHVMNRGTDGSTVFRDDIDYRLFVIELRNASTEHSAEVHAYCLMPNHYHLLLHTPEAGLPTFMRNLSSRFTQEINKRYLRDGPLFRGRFRSVIVEDYAQLMAVSRYIHRNPIAAGLATTIDQWVYSSAGAYLGSQGCPGWLTTEILLAMQGGADPASAYRSYIEAGSDPAAGAGRLDG